MLSHRRLIVGVPAFNEEKHLSFCLKSICAQTMEDFVVLVSDNSSNDRTEDIVREMAKIDSRILYHRQERNVGAAKNFQFLRDATDSPFFMWLGAHDAISDSYIRKQLAIIENDSALALVYSRTLWIDEENNPLRTTDGGKFVHSDSSGLQRYVKAARGPYDECTAVNGIFRREAIRGVRLLPIAGSDHLVLTHAQFYGRFYRNEEAIYHRREFESRESDYIQRIVGGGGKTKRGQKRRNMWPLACAQIADYLSLRERTWRKVVQLPVLIMNLDHSCGLILPRIIRYLREARTAMHLR